MGSVETPYGAKSKVDYADPGYRDNVARYPIDTEAHVRAAWAYINMPKNARFYTADQLKQIKERIQHAAKKFGIEISGGEGAMNEAGMYTPSPSSMPSAGTVKSMLSGAGPLAPPATWFRNPSLNGPTRLTVGEDGHVFGHLAQWRVCHVGIGNSCVIAPHSKMDYQLFKVGSLVCDDGSTVPIGKITLGTGHANAQWGVMPSREHYDNTGWAAAVVNIGEDQHGIWVNGSLTSGMTQERVAELRAAALSGDWREVNGHLELIAALAVNNPGFPVYRETNGRAFSLTAVGIVGSEEEAEGQVSGEFAADSTDAEGGDEAPKAGRLAEIEARRAAHVRSMRAKKLASVDAGRSEASTPLSQAQTFWMQRDAEYEEIPEDEEADTTE